MTTATYINQHSWRFAPYRHGEQRVTIVRVCLPFTRNSAECVYKPGSDRNATEVRL